MNIHIPNAMAFRNEAAATLKLSLGLSLEDLSLPASQRRHFLSLVHRPPEVAQHELFQSAKAWTSQWPKESYLIQPQEHLHWTIAGNFQLPTLAKAFQTNQHEVTLQKLVKCIQGQLGRFKEGSLSYTIKEPKISRSGINCELQELSKGMQSLIRGMREVLPDGGCDLPPPEVGQMKSITMLRYLQPENLKSHVKNIVGTPDPYDRHVDIQVLELVWLDKVAQHFEVIQRFELTG